MTTLRVAPLAFAFAIAACSSNTTSTNTGTGGHASTGGVTSSAGGASSGGKTGAGGSVGAGGISSSGGSLSTGGSIATGGTPSSGGGSGTGGGFATGGSGGTTNAGGTSSGGSAAGGTTGTGGVPASGGVAAGGATSKGGTASGGTTSAGGVAGGTTGTGGATGMGGVTSTGGSTAQACGSIASTATRPQMSASEAANYTAAKYLAGSDGWAPTGVTLPSSATYTVAADGSGTHKTIQAALDAVSGSSRVNILVKPGTYREKITYSKSTPVTLYGASSDASLVVIVNNKTAADYSGDSRASATFITNSAGFQAKNLTFSNDYDEVATNCSTNCQGVAFYSTGDKTVLDNVRALGNQDTVCLDSADTSTVARVYVTNSFIQGDTDFIYGRASAVIENSEIHYTTSWKPTNAGRQLAPSTQSSKTYGFLVYKSKFTADANTLNNKIYLGRAWDENSNANGQLLIRECDLGAHIRLTDPWAAAASSGRAYSATGNRLFEYCNTGAGAGQ